MGSKSYLRQLKVKFSSLYLRIEKRFQLFPHHHTESNEGLHCYIEDKEVTMKQCHLENDRSQSNTPENITSDKPHEDEIKIPSGSYISYINVKRGVIVEKIYLTPNGKRLTVKQKD